MTETSQNTGFWNCNRAAGAVMLLGVTLCAIAAFATDWRLGLVLIGGFLFETARRA